MRLLVVGHPFVLAHNQKKYVAMKQVDPDLQLRLVAPIRGRDRFHLTDCEVHCDLKAEEVVALPTSLSNWHMTYVHNPLKVARVMREFQPHIIHLEEDPQAFITLETISLQRSLVPSAKVTLFTWDNLLRSRGFPMSAIKRRLRAYSFCRVAAVICGNRRAAELLRAERCFHGAIEVLPQYGLDVRDHEPGTEPQLRSQLGLGEHVVIGFAGRFVPEKGIRLLMSALERLALKPWKLLLVGSGPLEEEIRRTWMPRLPGRIVIVPAVPCEEVPRYLRCSDLFVLPSFRTQSWMEQFGLALAEAMLLGIAAVGSSSGAIPEVLGPGGVVFEEGNVEELARLLARLLDAPAERQRLGFQARQFALTNYTQEGIAHEYLKVFRRVSSRPLGGETRDSTSVETTPQLSL
jgi:glycosyltransferase involved in cell wall biosynthesis